VAKIKKMLTQTPNSRNTNYLGALMFAKAKSLGTVVHISRMKQTRGMCFVLEEEREPGRRG
jgi:hypothetical protein